tara:strand:+ start:44 stop:784 length:741 start_codon:yes stop_codon:yes gene_type:complete
MNKRNIVLFADGFVGEKLVRFLLKSFRDQIILIITYKENQISKIAKRAKIKTFVFSDNKHLIANLPKKFDLGFLLWWPKIINKETLKLCKEGFYNLHPSLLPFSKGKHPNFWTIKNEEPYGVTMHKVALGIDTGEIIAQKSIPYDWEDNGGTLYKKSEKECINLFKKTFPKILDSKVKKTIENSGGSFHLAKEMFLESEIDLEKSYKAKDIFNLLRARTFIGKPSCWFLFKKSKYEIRIKIDKVKK